MMTTSEKSCHSLFWICPSFRMTKDDISFVDLCEREYQMKWTARYCSERIKWRSYCFRIFLSVHAFIFDFRLNCGECWALLCRSNRINLVARRMKGSNKFCIWKFDSTCGTSKKCAQPLADSFANSLAILNVVQTKDSFCCRKPAWLWIKIEMTKFVHALLHMIELRILSKWYGDCEKWWRQRRCARARRTKIQERRAVVAVFGTSHAKYEWNCTKSI